MAESVKANSPPRCLCGALHWSTQRELCGFYVKPVRRAAEPVGKESLPTPAPPQVAGETQKPAPGIGKTGVETQALIAKNTSEPIVRKKKTAEKPRQGGRPKKRALTPKAKKTA